ncbi:hypothetical protein ACWIUD_03195 [Helicobacter sp. 23-1044]
MGGAERDKLDSAIFVLFAESRKKNAESIAESRNFFAESRKNAESKKYFSSNRVQKQSKGLRYCFGLFSRETSEIGLIRPSSAVLCENNSNEYPRPNCQNAESREIRHKTTHSRRVA